jgi:hypothetical protein
MSTVSAAEHQSPPDLDAIHQWLMPLVRVQVWFRYEHGSWYCLAEDFDITGMGSSRDAAFSDMVDLLGAYLGSHYKAGAAFEQTLRPIPRKLKIQIRSQVAASSVRSRLARSRGAMRKSEELATFIPADALVRPAFC